MVARAWKWVNVIVGLGRISVGRAVGAERKQGFSLWEQLGGLVPVRGGSHLGLDVGFGQLSATVSGGHRDGRGALGTSWGAGRRQTSHPLCLGQQNHYI